MDEIKHISPAQPPIAPPLGQPDKPKHHSLVGRLVDATFLGGLMAASGLLSVMLINRLFKVKNSAATTATTLGVVEAGVMGAVGFVGSMMKTGRENQLAAMPQESTKFRDQLAAQTAATTDITR